MYTAKIIIVLCLALLATGCTSQQISSSILEGLSQSNIQNLLGKPSRQITNIRGNTVFVYQFDEKFEPPYSGYFSPLAPPSRQPEFNLSCLFLMEFNESTVRKVEAKGRSCNKIMQLINKKL